MSEKHVHSVKVPRLYKVASKILQLVEEKGASLKELVFDKGERNRLKHPNTRGIYALVVASIQNATILNQVIRESQILVKESIGPWLVRILITELLWGKTKLPISQAKPINTVAEYHSTFLTILREAVKSGTHENEPRRNKAEQKPRYIRVNTLLMSVGDALTAFRQEGWRRATAPGDDYAAFLQKLATLGEDEFIQDFHIKQLFAFPPRTEFFQHELYTNGSIILQDKATCLAPFVLNPTPGSAVLDMCAAPGMKTTQLAAIMQNKGTLYAVERHAHRYKTLCELVPHHGVTCVTTIQADATTITPQECQKVEYVLVDPTCSGSGMIRPTSSEDGTFDVDRLKKLAAFQEILLEKALTKFPFVKRVVYSTCSVYPEENEEVVEKVLRNINADPKRPQFKLADNVLESWPNRGSAKYEVGPSCLLSDPEKDFTTGCFIAVLEKVEPEKMSDENGCESKDGVEFDSMEGGKRKKKSKKRKRENKETKEENAICKVGKSEKKFKKRKKDQIEGNAEIEQNDDNHGVEDNSCNSKKKKKKRKKRKNVAEAENEMDGVNECSQETEGKCKKEKKGKRKENCEIDKNAEEVDGQETFVDDKKKKKRRKKERKE